MSQELQEKIIEMIRSKSDADAGEVRPETPLADLAIHSLEMAEIIFDIEEEYDVEIDMNTSDVWNNLETVNDIVIAVRELIAKKG
ncbi:acyl carrier protein [Chelativorans sp. ZYF759]|uniref:acyl carrier protein n=1 Tax=Chelativorans sp. ZYF759 TaxID=2692213 RepID=UPI00145EB55C|nr:acyl carrier protein [Chelativorans sp. ZYF759]NMG40809.1 acyl carrier protein [Chelativorans sp. ZYF759]